MANEFDSDDLFFFGMIAQAEVRAVLSIIHHICERAGISDIDGLSVMDCFFKERRDELDTLFRSLEDGNPGLAARLHARFEAAKQRLADDKL